MERKCQSNGFAHCDWARKNPSETIRPFASIPIESASGRPALSFSLGQLDAHVGEWPVRHTSSASPSLQRLTDQSTFLQERRTSPPVRSEPRPPHQWSRLLGRAELRGRLPQGRTKKTQHWLWASCHRSTLAPTSASSRESSCELSRLRARAT